jgi:hypothetical protein
MDELGGRLALPDVHQADTRIFIALRLLASEPLDMDREQKLRIITRLARALLLYYLSSNIPEHERDLQSNHALQWMFAPLDQDLLPKWESGRYFASKVKTFYGNGK